MNLRKEMKTMVKYILPKKEHDRDVIENYTDTMVLIAEEYKDEQLKLCGVSQQRELFNAMLDFSEELPMCTEDYHRSELWEKYKALNCG